MTRAPSIIECMTDEALFAPWFVGENDINQFVSS